MSFVFFLSVVAIFFCLVFIGCWWYCKKNFPEMALTTTLKFLSMVSGGLSTIFMVLSFLSTVPTSTIGVPTSFGEVVNTELREGLHMVPPWWKINNVFVGIDQATAKGVGGTSDTQTVNTEVSIRYSVEPGKASHLFSINPALNYEEMVVVPMIKDAFKFATAQFKAEELMRNRDIVRDRMLINLRQSLKPYGLIVQDIAITDFDFSGPFKKAVENKVIAVQQAQAALNDLERVRHETEQVRERARGEADAVTLKAKALENSRSKEYLQLRFIERWNGAMPMILGSNGNHILDISKVIPVAEPAK